MISDVVNYIVTKSSWKAFVKQFFFSKLNPVNYAAKLYDVAKADPYLW